MLCGVCGWSSSTLCELVLPNRRHYHDHQYVFFALYSLLCKYPPMFCISNNKLVVVSIVPISINPFICCQTDLAQRAVVQATTPPHTTVNTSVIRFTLLLPPAVMAKPHLLYNFFCPLPDTPLCSHNARQFLSEIRSRCIKAPCMNMHLLSEGKGEK